MPIYVGDRERSIRIKANSIMIDIIDRKSSKVIWRLGEGEVNNPEKAINAIRCYRYLQNCPIKLSSGG
ncbi:hypothetical protein CS542_05540 [Pedobacter sp. IW39]|nr:hypothetical protein CS542_05540 [Pedobacter sp. IW39]